MASLKTRLSSLGARLEGRRAGRRTPPEPLLSVVVPVYNVEAFLPACLDSLLGQTLAELEVICVDDGSTDDSLAILRQYAARDPRVHVLQQANAGQGAARNTAMAHVRGEFLTFADSDDEVPRGAYEEMIATLRRTGSDWVLGGAQRYTHGQLLEVVRGAAVHDRDRLAMRLEDFPVALQDIIPGNRLFRTAFYREHVPAYRTDVKYEDQVPCLAAFARGTFDVLEQVTYLWRIREDASSTTQQKTTIRNLRDQVEVMRESRELMRSAGSPVVYDAWVGRMIGVDLNGFVQPALQTSGGSVDEEFREVLRAAYAEILTDATPRALSHATLSAKVRATLVAAGDWDGVRSFEEYAQVNGRIPPTRVVDGRVLADPGEEQPWPRVPEAMWELGAYETPLRAAVHDVEVSGSDLVIRGYAGIGAIDSATYPPLVEARLGDVTATVAMVNDPNADLWAKDLNASFAAGAFTALVPLEALPLGPSILHVHISQAGLVREGSVHEVAEHSGAARLDPVFAAGQAVTPRLGQHGFEVALGPAASPERAPQLWITSLEIDDAAGQIVVGVRFTGLTEAEVARAEIGTRDVVVARAASYTADPGEGSGRLRFPTRTDLPGAPGVALEQRAGGLWVTRDGKPDVAAHPAPELHAALPLTLSGADLRLHLRRRPTGQAQLVPRGPLQLDEVTRYGRGRLRAAYRRATDPAPDVPASSVLLWADEGTSCDGALAAIDAQLAVTRPDLTRFWAVDGLDVPVPTGAVPLVIDSRHWYDALRSVPLILADSDLPEWFVKRPHQRLIHVAPGWPVVSIGAAHATERGLPVGLAALLADQVQAWDLLVAPGQEAADLYHRETGYAGDVLLAAPQTDPLLPSHAGHDRGRERVRAELGLAPDTTVVLYAPTYRDSRSSRVESAPMYDGLDLAGLAERLGPSYTVLVHAHRHDARTAEKRVRRTPVVDVSRYPRLADLLLSADAAVLDYGVERIDWALIDRPAVMFARDRDAYFGVRAPLLDYDESLPGPAVESTEEVVALLADLPALAETCRPLAARVRQGYLADADGRGAERVVARLADWL